MTAEVVDSFAAGVESGERTQAERDRGQRRREREAAGRRWYDAAYATCSSNAPAVDHSIDLFRTLTNVMARDRPAEYERWIAPLLGHDLACWCPLEDASGNRVPCHADVLLELANGATA